MAPVYTFAPLSVAIPAPVLMSMPGPEIKLASVFSPEPMESTRVPLLFMLVEALEDGCANRVPVCVSVAVIMDPMENEGA